MVHGRGGHETRDLDPVRTDVPVRQDEQRRASFPDGPARLAAELVHGFLECAGTGRPIEHGRQDLRLQPWPVERADTGKFLVGQHGPWDPKLSAMLGRFGEEVLLRSDGRVHRRDQFLADGVQGWIGHLGEKLLEVVEEQLRLVGQDGQRRVVAHGPDRLEPIGRHRTDEDLQFLARVSEGPLPVFQRPQVQAGHVIRLGQVVQVLHVFRQPLAVGAARTDLVLDLLVGDDAAPDRVDQEKAAGLQPSPHEDAFGRDLQHAGF